MKGDDNWTDYEHPCFQDYDGDYDSEMVEDCDAYRDECGDFRCHFIKMLGGSWATCKVGALSPYCPESLKPKEVTDDSALRSS